MAIILNNDVITGIQPTQLMEKMKNNNALIIGIGGMGQRYYAILKKLKFNKLILQKIIQKK